MKYIFIALLFSLYNIAQGEVPLDLYKQQKQSQILLTSKVEKKQNQIKVNITNDSQIVTNPIFPVDIDFLGQKNYELIQDKCSYKVLNPHEQCEILIKENKSSNFSFKVFSYGKEKQAVVITFGEKLVAKEFSSPENINLLPDLPLVERIGIGNYNDWEIVIPSKDLIEKISYDSSKIYVELTASNVKNKLRVYPKKEDYYEISIYLHTQDKIYEQKLRFTSLVRKPSEIKIIPQIDTVIQSYHPVEFKAIAQYASGIPEVWELPDYLVSWKGIENKEFVPDQVGNVKVSASALGLQSSPLDFKVLESWPYGQKGKIVIKDGETVTLTDYILDLESLTIEPKGVLKIENQHPWMFMGIKNNFINHGKIIYKQSYSGDLSVNFPNFDGSLSGSRMELKTPEQVGLHGGNIYIQAKNIYGNGIFDLSGVNEGRAYFYYLQSERFKGKIKGEKQESRQVFYPINEKFLRVDNTQPVDKTTAKYHSALTGSWYYIQRYLILAVFPTLILGLFAYRVRKYKIQKQSVPKKQMIKEFIWSMISAGLINFLVAALVTGTLKQYGFIKIYSQRDEYSILYYLLSFGLILILHDIYFYFTHRLLHTKYFYKYVHRIHHESSNPTPLTSLSFHPIEAFMHFMFIPLVTLVVPFHYEAIGFFLWAMLIFNVNGHSGFEYWPKFLLSGWRLTLINNSTHHNMHHEFYNCNYSLYFNLLDRWFKTNHKEYDHKFKK